jgi:hypothetical protein
VARNARLIGLEGRTIVNLAVADGTTVIRMPNFDQRNIVWTEPDACISYFDIIVYELDFEAEDGTLIFRRITPLWRN